MKNHLPKNMRDFAHRILESKFFLNFMTFMILVNVIVLVVLSEISKKTDPTSQKITLALNVVDWGITAACILELILRWVEDFCGFWKRKWDLFDFTITVMSILPEIIGVLTEKDNTSGILMILRQLQILRVLKFIIRIKALRLTAMIIMQSLKGAMAPFLLIIVCGYLNAVVGIVLFEKYTNSDVEDLIYKNNFKNLGNAVATLFILFTGDNWHALMRDTWKVPELSNTAIIIFIIIWDILAGFMLKMVFTADVVNNIEYSRRELNKDMEQIKQLKEGEVLKEQRMSSSSTEDEDIAWDAYKLKMLQEISGQEVQQLVWPKSHLMRYLEVMEELHECQEERERMQKLEVQSYLNLHNS
uniref:Ion transport domain-containing protein n=1 Tax=Astyanax mexicanus TaxID=7994 RepID=A0A8B9LIA2_ASTMX